MKSNKKNQFYIDHGFDLFLIKYCITPAFLISITSAFLLFAMLKINIFLPKVITSTYIKFFSAMMFLSFVLVFMWSESKKLVEFEKKHRISDTNSN